MVPSINKFRKRHTMKIDKNPWKLLGIKSSATLDEIKAAYKVKALKYHPDKFGGNPEMFMLVKTAYEQLKNKTYVPIVPKQDLKLINIQLSIYQQIHGVNNEIISVPEVGDIQLSIPPGAKLGDKFKVNAQGKKYILNIHELKNKHFTRHGFNCILDLELDIIDAMCGGKIDVATPCGDTIPLLISPGTNDKSQFVVEQYGLLDRKKHKRGNLHIVVQVKIPALATEKEKQEFITRFKK